MTAPDQHSPIAAAPPVAGDGTIDRASAFAAGPSGVPRKVWIIGGSVLLALALGGTLLERVFSSVGLNKKADTGAPATAPAIEPTAAVPKHPPGGRALAVFMGAQPLRATTAPSFRLVTEHAGFLRLQQEVGKVVVLSFFDGPCNDSCPVLGRELAEADASLKTDASKVQFLIVNTDPKAVAVSPAPAALTRTGLLGDANVTFLTAALPTLNSVWKAYGISVDVAASGAVAHSDYVYFIDRDGKLRYRATPYANESRSGVYSLPPSQEARWAHGIATYAASLLR